MPISRRMRDRLTIWVVMLALIAQLVDVVNGMLILAGLLTSAPS
jgi:hypothetical protein